jgi:DNA-binding CsgD family transcriptional regulator
MFDPKVREISSASVGPAVVEYALALLDLGAARWEEALNRLDSLSDAALSLMSLPDRIEAAVRAGRLDEAQASLEIFEAWAAESDSRWSLARLETARALMADGDEATRHFEHALWLAGNAQSFDRARIQLLYGEHLRRGRRRADSRVQLREALAVFEETQAGPWAERARTELLATGETARKRDPSTIDQLTPQELQISRFVAQGLANKEVAARLFLSPRTIDYHLRKVYVKLGITSRFQLALLPLAEMSTTAAAA